MFTKFYEILDSKTVG